MRDTTYQQAVARAEECGAKSDAAQARFFELSVQFETLHKSVHSALDRGDTFSVLMKDFRKCQAELYDAEKDVTATRREAIKAHEAASALAPDEVKRALWESMVQVYRDRRAERQ